MNINIIDCMHCAFSVKTNAVAALYFYEPIMPNTNNNICSYDTMANVSHSFIKFPK